MPRHRASAAAFATMPRLCRTASQSPSLNQSIVEAARTETKLSVNFPHWMFLQSSMTCAKLASSHLSFVNTFVPLGSRKISPSNGSFSISRMFCRTKSGCGTSQPYSMSFLAFGGCCASATADASTPAIAKQTIRPAMFHLSVWNPTSWMVDGQWLTWDMRDRVPVLAGIAGKRLVEWQITRYHGFGI